MDFKKKKNVDLYFLIHKIYIYNVNFKRMHKNAKKTNIKIH